MHNVGYSLPIEKTYCTTTNIKKLFITIIIIHEVTSYYNYRVDIVFIKFSNLT